MNQVAKLEAARPAPMMAGGAVRAIVPQSMEEAYRLATAICKAGMAPKGLDTPEKAMIAIMHGLEIGLTPLSALQRIAVVNGRPTIWGDAAMALVRGSGICEYVEETISGDGDKRTARCEAKRRNDPKVITRTFSMADAKKAGLAGKSGPWSQYPDRMLQMRARAFALRDGFADVLGGLYLREEIDDNTPMRDVTPVPSIPTPPPAPRLVHSPDPEHDPETGEVAETETDPALLPVNESNAMATALIRQIGRLKDADAMVNWKEENFEAIATLQPADRNLIMDEIEGRLAETYEAEPPDDEPED